MIFNFSFVGVCLITDIFKCITPKRFFIENASRTLKNLLHEYYTKGMNKMLEKYMSIYQILSTLAINQIIIYLRKSRSENGESVEEVLERHEKMLQEYAIKTFGARIPEENIYREVVSGETIVDRVEIQHVFNRINDKKEDIRGVLVIEPSRLSRGDLEDCGFLMKNFKISNTLIITPTKAYDLHDLNDFKMLRMELIQGNEYLEYNKTIMQRGIDISINEGKFVFATAPFGFDREKLKNRKGFKLVENEKEAEIVKMIYKMFIDDGLGTQAIAKYLNDNKIFTRDGNLWQHKVVGNILKNETYYGMIVKNRRHSVQRFENGKVITSLVKNPNYTIVKGLHDGIITKETFDKAQELMKAKSTTPKVVDDKELKNPFATLMVCSECQLTLHRSHHKRNFKIRKYDFDKQELIKLLRKHKELSKISGKEISRIINLPYPTVSSWFTPKAKKCFGIVFADNWYNLKEILQITTNEFDKAITTYEDAKDQDTLYCKSIYCEVGATLISILEKKVIEALKEELVNFNYFVDNYEQELKKQTLSNARQIKKLDKEINILVDAIDNVRHDYNLRRFTYEEYIKDKERYEEELEKLKKQKNDLEASETTEIIIQYKKAIPKLEKCIQNYFKLKTINEKNDLLKSIIEKIEYKKPKGFSSNNIEKLELKIYLKI